MRRLRAHSPPTLREIMEAVKTLIFKEHLPDGRHQWFFDQRKGDDFRILQVRRALLDAEELGLVAPFENEAMLYENQRWRIADSWQPPGRSGGGDDGRGPTRDDGDGNQGGGGLTEVLSHPVLFSLDKDDFEAVIEGLFAEGRS